MTPTLLFTEKQLDCHLHGITRDSRRCCTTELESPSALVLQLPCIWA